MKHQAIAAALLVLSSMAAAQGLPLAMPKAPSMQTERLEILMQERAEVQERLKKGNDEQKDRAARDLQALDAEISRVKGDHSERRADRADPQKKNAEPKAASFHPWDIFQNFPNKE